MLFCSSVAVANDKLLHLRHALCCYSAVKRAVLHLPLERKYVLRTDRQILISLLSSASHFQRSVPHWHAHLFYFYFEIRQYYRGVNITDAVFQLSTPSQSSQEIEEIVSQTAPCVETKNELQEVSV